MKKCLKGYFWRNFVWKKAIFGETFKIFGTLVMTLIVSAIDFLQIWYKKIENLSLKDIVRQALLLQKKFLKNEELNEEKIFVFVQKLVQNFVKPGTRSLVPFVVLTAWKIAIQLKHRSIFLL